MSASRWRVAVVGFDHMHAGDQIQLARTLPETSLVAAVDSDPARLAAVCDDLGVDPAIRFTDWRRCLDVARPTVACVCSTTADHLTWVRRLAARGVHVLLEKPFAQSTAEVDAMVAAAAAGGVTLAVNWPSQWYPVHRTARRLIAEGAIGRVVEVHHYGGNRGPLRHGHGKKERDGTVDPGSSWWYQRAAGGGSLRDYLGYGATVGAWFRDGEAPTEVTATLHVPAGLEVDEQSVVVAAYPSGLSVFQTRWGTFTDPWTHQPQPRCGFVVAGTGGTVSSYDYDPHVRLQTRAHPEGVDVPAGGPPAHERSALANLVHALDTGKALAGPISPSISRVGQQVVDAAVASADRRAPVRLPGSTTPTERQP